MEAASIRPLQGAEMVEFRGASELVPGETLVRSRRLNHARTRGSRRSRWSPRSAIQPLGGHRIHVVHATGETVRIEYAASVRPRIVETCVAVDGSSDGGGSLAVISPQGEEVARVPADPVANQPVQLQGGPVVLRLVLHGEREPPDHGLVHVDGSFTVTDQRTLSGATRVKRSTSVSVSGLAPR